MRFGNRLFFKDGAAVFYVISRICATSIVHTFQTITSVPGLLMQCLFLLANLCC